MSVERIFHEALDDFLAKEFTLVRKHAHEQSFCGRLAIYLDQAKDRHGLKGYYVDVEYNRNREGRKQILNPLTNQPINVICDLLLHSRAELDDDNLIAVEMKKAGARRRAKEHDRERLMALTTPLPHSGQLDYVCGYQVGYYLEVNIRYATLLVEEYRDGRFARGGTLEFADPQKGHQPGSTSGETAAGSPSRSVRWS